MLIPLLAMVEAEGARPYLCTLAALTKTRPAHGTLAGILLVR